MLALSALVELGRHTAAGMLSASVQTGVDWSAAYLRAVRVLVRFDLNCGEEPWGVNFNHFINRYGGQDEYR